MDTETESDGSDTEVFEYSLSEDGNTSESDDQSDETDESDVGNQNNNWKPVKKKNELSFNQNNEIIGVNPDFIETMKEEGPLEFYKLFIDDILNTLVEETNRYAIQKLEKKRKEKKLKKFSRIKKWKPVDSHEMKKFIGCVMYMEIVKLPQMKDYWRTDKFVQTNLDKQLSKDRFLNILSNFHCSDNSTSDKEDKLYKIRSFIDKMENNFQMCYTPGKLVCIDESMVPFQGRLSFKQYNKGKTHKYGIKIFKLGTENFYTLKYRVYIGKEEKKENLADSLPTRIVMEMMSQYLNCGRTLICDNWYTSVTLAKKLLDNKTHLIGTLRKNRKENPKYVVNKKLKRGQYVALQNRNNITIMKWKDKRDVLLLSTKHKDDFQEVTYHGKTVKKPSIIIDYNKGKGFIDLNDQMSAYIQHLRRSIKWYRKIVFDLLTSIAVINAHSLYKDVTGNSIDIVKFKEEIVKGLFQENDVEQIDGNDDGNNMKSMSHKLTKTNKRNRCHKCYEVLRKTETRVSAQKHAKKTYDICKVCGWFYCKRCFFKSHNFKK